ncbi:MAG: 16S rRNA (adenine(1518)-N(6)/adenine(1519)-N(6))-dimethyltransferase RsmA [Muribaculaceae bacterium]|nr:16S rRNA (adenine(1518)-N(6)/adenine(1519)-N(6))-dimethyltransferase RsmA [Bacteroidales bacterium]MBQ1484833.1 16S rRNA (adenine(1518)-N(6)/adenine(1519)-N(6))-dimethyltransferase RsmA [Muribaculaceae bacterium]MBQ1584991.1 16S rRNA (adenine(1518)-N(6)/adenine(1519)-N(6))-dimethyltransferase RsmA [Muribaculaceae bacterium]MBQ1746360.1 16S rRNA (adenine(1518)-N(6)/adenine(1519)-N(6))-dimethyltransferase RsmA [Muribaculaceae bacterium]MBR0493635.1 16S rRNA (adenine(1518)-N(6)/adenine(1519)-N(
MRKVRAKKSLGQHFLTDLSIAERIAHTLDDFRHLPVLEVGPGMGVLTQFLLEMGLDLTVVELDSESVDYLEVAYPQLHGRIIGEDFLKMDLHELYGDKPFCVIGNYPYNISTQIFFKVLDYRDQVACCSGMLQREVAQRIAEPPGSKAYGILSVLLQAWYDIEYLFTVDEHVFNPPPKVKSGVIRLTRNSVTDLGVDERMFKRLVKLSFGQRRKMLRSSLKSVFMADPAVMERDVFRQRPEQLGVDDFIALTELATSIGQ